MAGTKTGVGGFEIDGKIHEFDVGDPNAPGTPPENLPNPDSGDISVDKSKKDISKGTRITLSKYLKNVTSDNRYPIDGNYTETSITDEKGVPQPLSKNPINNPQFTTREAAAGTSVGPGGDPASALSGELSKGKQDPLYTDGNALLPSVQKNSLPPPVNKYTSAVLKNNRFKPSTLSSPEVMMVGFDDFNKPKADYNPTLTSPKYGSVTMGRLAQVGVALSHRASEELNSAGRQINPTSGDQEAAALLPSANQIGATKVESYVLEAQDVLRSLTNDEIPEQYFTNISDKSWGTLNNIDDQFSGIQSLGMIGLSVALTSAVVLLFEGLGFLLSLIKGGSTGAARSAAGRYILGRSTVTKQSNPDSFPPSFPPDIGSLLGIRSTVYPLGTALKKGTAAFFGIDDTGGFSAAVGSTLKSASSSPGFNAVVARTIIRSSNFVVDAFAKLNTPNIVSGIRSILNIVEVIRTSKLISAINVFAMLGDQILTMPQYAAIDATEEEPTKVSTIDAQFDDAPGTSVRKNRLRGKNGTGTLKLAWSSNRAPAMYLIPDSVLSMVVADNKLGGFKGAISLHDEDGKTVKAIMSGEQKRISRRDGPRDKDTNKLDVKSFEAALEAEYVPFSFHDLRTNELISFHAFLASMTDDYAVNWEQTEGYGRVDKVKIYKDTQRTIGMSFYVVATSESDFNDMWVKINKLTTLVYPQYTKGRMLDDGDKSKFIQPFSQMIGASPLVRLRLGDLFRSNYSRFALARLFGLGGNDTLKLDGTTVEAFSGGKDKYSKFQAKLNNLPSTTGAEFTLSSDGFPISVGAGGLSLPIPMSAGASSPSQSPTLRIEMQDAPYIVLKQVRVTGDGSMVECSVSIMPCAEMCSTYGFTENAAARVKAALDHKYNNKENIAMKIVGDQHYTVPARFLKPTQKSIDSVYTEMFNVGGSDIEKISKFLDVEKNALVKSFNSIQGKGLAGAIQSLNFDWYDKVTWETLPGSTAPKMCKVTIQFAPIHDISPGIDHQGYNRAPIYPVGVMGPGQDPESSGGGGNP